MSGEPLIAERATSEWQDLDDLWVYTNAGSSGAKWSLVPPGSTAPGPRHHAAWSCGAGSS